MLLDLDLSTDLTWFLPVLPGVVPEGTKIVSHRGSTSIFMSALLFLPDIKVGVVILINSFEGNAIIETIYETALNLMYEAKTGTQVAIPEQAEPAPIASFSSADLIKYEGYYETDEGFQTVTVKNDKLITEVYGKKVQFVPRIDGTFSSRFLLLGFIPIKFKELEDSLISIESINRRDVVIEHNQGIKTLVGSRVDPYSISKPWENRIGFYLNQDPGEDPVYIKSINIRREANFLFADLSILNKPQNQEFSWNVVLIPLSDSRAKIGGIGRERGVSIQIRNLNGEESLNCYGYSFKRLEE